MKFNRREFFFLKKRLFNEHEHTKLRNPKKYIYKKKGKMDMLVQYYYYKLRFRQDEEPNVKGKPELPPHFSVLFLLLSK